MNINIKQLEAFVWVADLGNFRLAAERLHTTQPNVSVRISALEGVLGVKLLKRESGVASITKEGEPLLEHAREVLRALEDLLQASGQESLTDGVLKLGVTELIVHTWLRSFLQAMNKKYPKLNIELTVDVSSRLRKDLQDRTIDLAILSETVEAGIDNFESIATYPYIWVCSPELDIERNKSLGTTDLDGFTVLTHSRDTIAYVEITEHFSKHSSGTRVVPSGSMSACLHMAIAGMGIAALPAEMVMDEIENGSLVQIAYRWVPGSLNFFAEYEIKRSSAFVKDAAESAKLIATGQV